MGRHPRSPQNCDFPDLRRNPRRSGFTLVEILLVLAILGAIAAMVVPNLLNRQKVANVDATRININAVEQAMKMFAIDHAGQYPPANQEIEALLQAPPRDSRWNGPYLETQPNDAWGQPLRCVTSSTTGEPQVFSVGPDGREGTDDDVFGRKT